MLCALRKNENLKRMYHFEGRIARRDGYYISRDVSRAAMVTIIEGSCRVLRQMHGQLCPPWVLDCETAGVYH